MSRLNTVTRRTFLVGSVAVTGGVAFGTYLAKKPHDNPLKTGLKAGEATFNPWVLIDAEKITLIVPHMDMGQGVASVQAALIAEEMDLAFGQFEISFGLPSAAYFNTALAAEATPFLSNDESIPARVMRTVMGSAFKILGLQVTGGSSTVPDSFYKLRMAGATARETLKKAASIQTGVAIDQLKTANGQVILPDGNQLAYTALAATAAGMKVVHHNVLRDPEQWRLLGQPMQRLDVVGKSTGTLKYGIDLNFEDMLYAAVSINPRKGGAIRSYDAAVANNIRGVKQVLAVTNGVAVIADNTWRAIKAAEAIDCDWAPAEYPAEQSGHWQQVAASFTEKSLDKEWRNDGDVTQQLTSIDNIQAEYKAPYVAHQPLEPLNATIKVTAQRVDIWVAHQIPRIAQQKVAAITGHEEHQVFLHNQYAGGSFGHRLEFENVLLAAEIGMQIPDKTIKLTYSREQDFAQDFTRQIGMARGKGGVKNGQVDSMDLAVATVSSSTSQSKRLGQAAPGPDKQIIEGAWNLPYAIPNFRVRAYRVPELAPTSSWRSVGASTAGFFAECFMDELIHLAGADGLSERIRLCDDEVAKQVLITAGELSGWDEPLGDKQGRGVALVKSFGVPIAEVVEVTQTDRGIRIDQVTVVADVGRVIDPVNFDNLVKGGVVWGLGHAMNCEITYSDGKAQQNNYHQHQAMRMHQCPKIKVKGLTNATKIRGIGEPPIPPAAPALANAIFAATGQRIREMPFNKHIKFI